MFYQYRQNNSGGAFHIDDLVGHIVIIEANRALAADQIAEMKAGIYFDGCSSGRDCSCCGDRWYPANEGTPEPMIYDEPAREYEALGGPERIVIHYANGTVEAFDSKSRRSA